MVTAPWAIATIGFLTALSAVTCFALDQIPRLVESTTRAVKALRALRQVVRGESGAIGSPDTDSAVGARPWDSETTQWAQHAPVDRADPE